MMPWQSSTDRSGTPGDLSAEQGLSHSTGAKGGWKALGFVLMAALALSVLPLGSEVGFGEGRGISASTPLAPRAAPAGVSASPAEPHALAAYGSLPLSFVRNAGQTDSSARYYAQGPGYSFTFSPVHALLTFAKGTRGAALALRFMGANAKSGPEGRRRLPGKVNYLLGTDSAGWRTSLPTYGDVVYRSLWPGVDMAFHGEEGHLKYEFVVGPGARVQDIRLAYRGTDGLSVDSRGDLRIRTPLGVLIDARPVSYQEIGGRRLQVISRFALGRDGAFGFAVGGYDRNQPLVIDPGLAYSTFLGGSLDDVGVGIAVDGAGNAYITGDTRSADFPTTTGAFDTSFNAGIGDAFVTKLNRTGTALLYSTYLGGGGLDVGLGIAVDGAGHAYVTGWTESADFPTSPGAFDTSYNGSRDAFVTKLNRTGAALRYSTYLGGEGIDQGSGIGVNGAGDAYVTGITPSSDFPTTRGALDTSFNGDRDAFVTKLNRTGTALRYSTYLGKESLDLGSWIALDGSGNAFVTGLTDSADFPTTAGAFDASFNGGLDAFVAKLDRTGATLLYSTYLGGGDEDQSLGIALDGAGDAYVTGFTFSANFPTTSGALDTSYNGDLDAFVTKLNRTGTALLYSTYLGGKAPEVSAAIAVDGAGNAYVTGWTDSADFPASPGAFDTSYNGDTDAFVTKLNRTGTALRYSTYLGKESLDLGSSIALDGAGNAYITGETLSSNFPITGGAFDTSFNGEIEAFVTKLMLTA